MGEGKIIIYTASAGSGKTHTLTREYLAYLFVNPSSYRRILAVTFTNKAAAEMKRRILDELADIANGKETEILGELLKREEIRQIGANKPLEKRAAQILSLILGDYTRFSVGTIDSFFQKVFRAFTREIGVQSNFNLYLEHNQILKETIAGLINGLNDNDELREWLVAYAGLLFDDGKNINLERAVYDLAHTVFTEQYKLLPEEAKNRLSDLKGIKGIIDELAESSHYFLVQIKELAKRATQILDNCGVDDSMLAGGKNGIGGYLRKIASGELKEPTDTVVKNLENDKWTASKGDTSAVNSALAAGFAEAAKKVVNFYREGIESYNTVSLVTQNIHMAAILSDVVNAVRATTNAENSFILADTGDLLMKVIGNDQTPFIYEKTGNEYDLFMIDEFQDTSTIQYRNFKPLLENSIAQGFDSMIVGDVKQSIYRWRNGEWSILGKQLKTDFTPKRVENRPLLVNWRSLPEIVKFNNSLFNRLSAHIDKEFGETDGFFSFKEVYNDLVQTVPQSKTGGYVRIERVDKETDKSIQKSQKERVLESLPQIIQKCQDDGYDASDIGILVRAKNEGTLIMDFLAQYADNLSATEKEQYNFNMLSADSLLVGNSDAVRFIVATMKRVFGENNNINRGEMLGYYTLAKNRPDENFKNTFSDLNEAEKEIYPEGFAGFLGSIVAKPLFEMGEAIIEFFGLNDGGADMAAISFFQDQVLAYMNNKGSDIRGFTEWWIDQGFKANIVLSGDQDAISIMTIHKAKGLQFKVVIVPFISWDFDTKYSTLLWVVPDTDPLLKLGAFPVNYSGNLDKTRFKPYYHNEHRSAYLDNLNLLYVAFTRAEERLYGFAIPTKKNEAGSILLSALTADVEQTGGNSENTTVNFGDYFDNATGIYEQGEPRPNRAKKVTDNPIDLGYPVYKEGGRLRLGISGGNILKNADTKLGSKAYYGTVLHEILGKIKVEEDIDQAVESASTEGTLPGGAVEEIKSKLKSLLTADRAKRWFAPGKEVLTEPEILTGFGDIKRPDRVVINGNKASVIDYKFGEEREEHGKQVKIYGELLAGLGYTVEERCLWYVEQNKIIDI